MNFSKRLQLENLKNRSIFEDFLLLVFLGCEVLFGFFCFVFSKLKDLPRKIKDTEKFTYSTICYKNIKRKLNDRMNNIKTHGLEHVTEILASTHYSPQGFGFCHS